jgi:phage protein D
MSTGSSSALAFEVKVGGKTFTQPDNKGLEQLVFEDHVDMLDQVMVRIGGSEEQDEWGFNIGDEVEVKIGQGSKTIFSGEITAIEPGYQVEGSATVTVRALDKMHRLGRGRKTKYWEKKKDSDVVQEVGAECGLSVDADATEETHDYILQRNESNIAFIKRLAARNNFLARVVDGKLEFKKASFQGQSSSIKMGENLRSVRMAFNSSDMVQKVVVRGWDIKKKQEIVGQASAGDVTSIGGGQIGAQAAGKFGDSTAYITDVPVSSQSMANAIAKAEMERIARQFCHGSCSMKGNDSVRAGTMLEFDGLSKNFKGKYYVMASRHIISARTGYTTEAMICSNTFGS